MNVVPSVGPALEPNVTVSGVGGRKTSTETVAVSTPPLPSEIV